MNKKFTLILLFPFMILLTFNITIQFPVQVETTDKFQLNINAYIYYINGNGQLGSAASGGNGSANNPYIIEDLVVHAPGAFDFAIYIQDTTDFFILRNCTATGGSQGITLDNVINGRIENCTAKNTDYGISVMHSDNSTVYNNTVSQIGNIGIDLYASGNCDVLHNIITDGVPGWYGIRVYTDYFQNISLNTINDYGSGIYLEAPDNTTVAYNTIFERSDGINIYKSENNTIFGNTIYNSYKGINLNTNSFNNKIIANNVSYNSHGIYVERGDYSYFFNNTANHNDNSGFWIDATSNFLNLSLNIANYNGEYGYHIKFSSSINFTHNTAIGNNKTGLYLESGDYSTFLNNTINRNLQYGIHLDAYSNGNHIEWNRLWYNVVPIHVESSCPCNIIQNNDIKYLVTLTEGEISPLKGDKSTLFTYTVTYTHVDNIEPDYVRVVIDQVSYLMQKQNPSDNTYSDGCIYNYTTSFEADQHSYYFDAGAGNYSARYPASGLSIGPRITVPIPGYPIILILFALISYLGLSLLRKTCVK